jgi:hypothetical protein|nr:MAG: hypothetical protein DIU61_09280 [Bacteroidota bacterium]
MESSIPLRSIGGLELARKVGFVSSLLAFIAASSFGIAQIFQIVGVLAFPVDAYLIYGFSLGIAAPFVVATISLYHLLPAEKRFWAHIALAFAVMYAIYVNLNYVVQVVTVLPAAQRGTLEEVRILDQTPHSLFWDIDALGYICMGISTFFLGLAFSKEQKWLRIFLFTNAAMVPVISFVYFYPTFSTTILLIASPWIVTTCGSLLLLAVYFALLR